jgi:hypothetical protein
LEKGSKTKVLMDSGKVMVEMNADLKSKGYEFA